MSAAMHSLVVPLHTDSMSESIESFLYGVSMKICVCLCVADSLSMLLSLSFRSSVFAGRYPQNANDCPSSPEDISASIRDDGPTNGITSIPCLWASATRVAPGSATAGSPASDISPTSLPSLNSCRYPSTSRGSVCSLSSWNSRPEICPFSPALERNLLAVRVSSTTNVLMVRIFSSTGPGITSTGSLSPRGEGIRYSFPYVILFFCLCRCGIHFLRLQSLYGSFSRLSLFLHLPARPPPFSSSP